MIDDLELKLNNKVAKYFENLESKINRNTQVLDKQPGNGYHVPTIVSLGNSQIIPNDDNPIILISPKAGMIRDIYKKEEDKKKILIRRLIGYSSASRLIFMSDIEIEKNLNLLTTEMLMTLNKELGFGPETPNAGQFYGIFKESKLDTKYFTEKNDFAAFELRLYSDTWSCIDLKEEKC